MINNEFIKSKHNVIEEIERFFKEIDMLIAIEEFIISLYIKEMPIAKNIILILILMGLIILGIWLYK